ncbi:hypothetical protein [Lentzea flava]|uniref:Excreted virulence factor EspC, type VII ESX diderm n=1 Tax=Lentzea flava TaxID=103732 RepID=A0ABQ2V333_9PSEU|nr:hypothetical protein [Lentzea flava]MCP2203251.1 hypothetical protein [Lentzea flava]GGU66767.1 hypothetical protein GCM10010178_68280 [Lentzea flava]
MGNDKFKIVTPKLRAEGKLWVERAAATRPILQAVQGAHLAPPAFAVFDAVVLGQHGLSAAAYNAQKEAANYEAFRGFMEGLLQSAITEFEQIDGTLRKIADEYDRVEDINEIDIDTFFHA